MIDSVILKIPFKNCIIEDKYLFENFDSFIYSQTDRQINWNPTPDDCRILYFPKVSIVRHFDKETQSIRMFLTIVCSIPKLLFGNNLHEIDPEIHSPYFIALKLSARLKLKGIIIEAKYIEYAMVVQIHYSKNIYLDKCSTVSNVINTISKCNFDNKLKSQKRDYENQGQSISFSAKSYRITAYDKQLEMKSIYKKLKDGPMKDMYEKILENNKNSQIFRFEVQLTKKTIIKARVLDYYTSGADKEYKEKFAQELKMKYSTEYGLFHNLCNPKFSKWILNLYWNKVKSCINLPKTENDLKRIVDKILQDKNQFKTGKLLANIGSVYLICIYGTKTLREISAKKCREVNKLLEEIKLNSYYKANSFDKISEDLKTFQPIKPTIDEFEAQNKCEEAACYLKSGTQINQELQDRFNYIYKDKPEQNPFNNLVKSKQNENLEDDEIEDNFEDEIDDDEDIINEEDFDTIYNKKYEEDYQNLLQEDCDTKAFQFDKDIHYKYEPQKRDIFIKTTKKDVQKRKEFNKNLEQKLSSQLKPEPKKELVEDDDYDSKLSDYVS